MNLQNSKVTSFSIVNLTDKLSAVSHLFYI